MQSRCCITKPPTPLADTLSEQTAECIGVLDTLDLIWRRYPRAYARAQELLLVRDEATRSDQYKLNGICQQ